MRHTWDSGERNDLPAKLGEVIGAYRLDAVIGRGGMSCVYAATHLKLERRVALKVLLPQLAEDAAYVERFFHEARIVNAVRHPNIVDISDFLEMENPRRVAYVMELLEGKTLREVLAERPLTELQALDAAIQLASALAAVHQVGVVHRDLKPANIIVTGEVLPDAPTVPSIRLLDFGVAKRPQWLAPTSSPGHLVGTPAYMSPEQIDGIVEPAADIYALGVILYEMVTGQPLFAGEAIAVLMSKVSFEPVPLKLPIGLKMREEFALLISSCIDAHQDRRPSIAQLLERLKSLYAQLLGSGEDTVESPRILESEIPAPRTTRKNLFMRLGAASFALAAVVILWTGIDNPATAVSMPVELAAEPELLPELDQEMLAELVPSHEVDPAPELDVKTIEPTTETLTSAVPNENKKARPALHKSQRASEPLTRDNMLPW